MAVCDLAELQSDAQCINCLSDSEKKRAYLWLLASALNDLTGENFTSIATLRSAVACWCESDSALTAFKTVIANNLALNVGAFPTVRTANQLQTAIACWCDSGENEFKRMEAFLLCRIIENLT